MNGSDSGMLTRIAGIVLTVAACSGVEDGKASPFTRVEGFCREWAEAACNDRVVERCSAADKDTCIGSQQAFCEELVPDGKYSPAGAKDCVDAVLAAYKDAELTPEEAATVLRLGPPCDLVLSGSAGRGEACSETPDCNREADLVCVRKPGNAEGTCQEPMEVGGGFACSAADAVCVPGFYCDGANCLAEKSAGAACSIDVPCAASARCERLDGSPPDPELDDATCIAKLGVGSACENDEDCLSSICAIAAGAPTGVCSGLVVLSPTDPTCRNLR